MVLDLPQVVVSGRGRKAPRATKRPPRGSPKSSGSRRYSGMQRRPNIGWRLRQMREEAGLTQVELAALTREVDPVGRGVGAYTVTRQENNRHTPKAHSIELLARALSKALGRDVAAVYLMGAGIPGVTSYLERERKRRGATINAFAQSLGFEVDRYRDLLDSGSWSSEDLGKIVLEVPEAGPLVADLLASRVVIQRNRRLEREQGGLASLSASE